MAHMVIFVLNDPDQCDALLQAWENAGIHGITILESTGLGRAKSGCARDDIPLLPSLANLLQNKECNHRTLFSIVKTQEQIDAILEATQSVVGSLYEENTGFLFVLPVNQVYGKGWEKS